MTQTVTFSTTLTGIGNNTGIEVAPTDLASLGASKRPVVRVSVNGYEFESTVGSMGGKHLISVSAAIRKKTGLKAGDAIAVTLILLDAPRTIELPSDFAAALSKNVGARSFFEKLPNSLQRYHIDNINSAKTDETRRKRIEKAIELFDSGKQR